jgi:hypothetical protein
MIIKNLGSGGAFRNYDSLSYINGRVFYSDPYDFEEDDDDDYESEEDEETEDCEGE